MMFFKDMTLEEATAFYKRVKAEQEHVHDSKTERLNYNILTDIYFWTDGLRKDYSRRTHDNEN